MQDGKEEVLTQTFVINVASVPASDLSFGPRPTLTSDVHAGRRVNSDSILPNVAGTTGRFVEARRYPNVADSNHSYRPLQPVLPQAGALTTQDAQMMQVLTSAAQRVAQEAQAHVISAVNPHEAPGPELQALAKQQHVLTVTAQALDQEVSAPPEAVPPSSHALVAAAQQVVFQAARQCAVERMDVMSMAVGLPAQAQPAAGSAVTVNEVSVATQTAVAQAVEITGPLSSEVDVMMTASSLLQQQSMMVPSTAVEPSASSMPPNAVDPMRPHSTGTVPSHYPLVQPSSALLPFPTASGIPPSLSALGPVDF